MTINVKDNRRNTTFNSLFPGILFRLKGDSVIYIKTTSILSSSGVTFNAVTLHSGLQSSVGLYNEVEILVQVGDLKLEVA